MDSKRLSQMISRMAALNRLEDMPALDLDFALKKSTTYSVEARTKGNDVLKKPKHSSLVHKKILLCFTESIAFAPNNSEELALGYNNRSILLHHLKKYDRAVEDIDRALACTKSNVLKAKLLCRKASCLNYVDRTKFRPVAEEARICIENLDDRLTDIKSKLRTSLGLSMQTFRKPAPKQPSEETEKSLDLTPREKNIEIKQNATFGRHLTTNADVEPGEILIVQDAYAMCPQEDFMFLVCAFCLNCAWNGIPCETCPCVVYCSEDCKQKAWEKYHEVECPLLSVLLGNGLDSTQEPLTLRIIATALQEKNMDGKISNLLKVYKEELKKDFAPENFTAGTFRSVCHLSSSHELFTGHVANEYKSRARKMTTLLDPMLKKEPKVSVDELRDFVLKLSGIVQANSFLYQGSTCFCEGPDKSEPDHECKSMRLGIFLVANSCSLINHSCIFNVGRTMKNGKVVVFSTQPIMKDRQLFFTYSPTILEAKPKRQEYLQNIHWFTCKCVPCVENWVALSKMPEAQHDIDTFHAWRKNQMVEKGSEIEQYDDYIRMIPELKKVIKDIFSMNTTFKAEVKSHHFQNFLYYAMGVVYGTQLTIPAACRT